MSRISNIETWARRIMRFCPIAAISQEMVKFDMQAMDNPQIEAAQYQQGTLAGYEVREYLLLKWGHKCTYCLAHDVPLQVEHIVSRARGGSNRVSNLCLACSACNSK
jgi:5-methylcytosine-specific restriction endonuclease McrA